MRLLDELRRELKNFNLLRAIKLNERIHDLIEDSNNNFEISGKEDYLWFKLMDKIEENDCE
jgi:hypothetical protein